MPCQCIVVLYGRKLFTVTSTSSPSSTMRGGPGNWPLIKACWRSTPSGALVSHVRLSSNFFVGRDGTRCKAAPSPMKQNRIDGFISIGLLGILDVVHTWKIIVRTE